MLRSKTTSIAIVLLCVIGLVACGSGAAEPASTTETSTGGGEPATASEPATAAGPATEIAIPALAGGELTTGRARVHGHAVQLQESGGSIMEIELGAERTSDPQPKVYCRPSQSAPVAASAVEWMAELTVEGTIDTSGDRVTLRDCVLVP